MLKSFAAVDKAIEFFKKYTTVDENYAQIRQVAISNKRPRIVDIQPVVVGSGEKMGFLPVSNEVLDGCMAFYQNWVNAGVV